jgi:16S rRNA processing protein RimM
MTEELILIAVIRRPHGVQGEVTAESYTFDDKRFKKLTTVFVKRNIDKEPVELTLTNSRPTPKGLLFTFKEITDRDVAETYRNAEILIPASDRLPLKKGLAYLDEYPGMRVLDANSKEEIGKIKDLMEMPAGNVLVIKLVSGDERLVSMAGDEYKKVDRAKRTVEVELMEEWGS